MSATCAARSTSGSRRSTSGGTYVPMSGLMRAPAAIPLLGPLLTGPRGEGFFGITFLIQGPMAQPEVIVNPLSLLTPGIIREICSRRRTRAWCRATGPRPRGRRAASSAPAACCPGSDRPRSVAPEVWRQLVGGDQQCRRDERSRRSRHAVRAAPDGGIGFATWRRSGILNPPANAGRTRCRSASSASPESSRAAGVRRQRVRLDRRRGDLVQAARRFVGAGFNCIDTADVYSRVGARPRGRRVRDHHRQLAEGARQPRQGRHRHQGRHARWGSGKGLAQGLHHRARSRTR